MGTDLRVIQYDIPIWNEYKKLKGLVKPLQKKYLDTWLPDCKSVTEAYGFNIVLAVDSYGFTLAELEAMLYTKLKHDNARSVRTLYTRFTARRHLNKKPKSELSMGDASLIDKYVQARTKFIINVMGLVGHLSIELKQCLLEMIVFGEISVFDLNMILSHKTIVRTIEHLFVFEKGTTAAWKGRYASSLRNKLICELGDMMSDFLDGICMSDIGEIITEDAKVMVNIKEHIFSKKYKNKVYIKGLKICMDKLGKDARVICNPDNFTIKLLETYEDNGHIWLKNETYVADDNHNFSFNYQVKVLPEGRRLFYKYQHLLKKESGN